MVKHQRIYHPSGDNQSKPKPPDTYKKHVCEFVNCGKRFPSNHELLRHINIHVGHKEFQCYQCEKKFTQKGHLRDHWRIHQGVKEYRCSICTRAFTLNSNLKRHIKMKHGILDETFYQTENQLIDQVFYQKDFFWWYVYYEGQHGYTYCMDIFTVYIVITVSVHLFTSYGFTRK